MKTPFLHAGGDFVVRLSDVVAIIDRRTTDEPGPTREMVEYLKGRGSVEDVSAGEVNSIIVLAPRRRSRRRATGAARGVLSPISVGTLQRRVGNLEDLG